VTPAASSRPAAAETIPTPEEILEAVDRIVWGEDNAEWERPDGTADRFKLALLIEDALRAEYERGARERWLPIDTAPKDGREIDIWVTGPGSRRLADCRWGRPRRGPLCSPPPDAPLQWTTRDGWPLDPRNGVPTHYQEITPPAQDGGNGSEKV
jgi:hypothetical protein